MSQPNNAIAHFETLSREKASFEQALAQADSDRARVQARLQELAAKKEQLQLASRKLADQVGQLHQQKTSLESEKARLQTVLRQERAALEQCAADTDALVTQERARKNDFCRDMAALNDELGSLLLQQESMRLMQMLSVETVAVVLAGNDDPALQEAASQLKEASEQYECKQAAKALLQDTLQKLRKLAVRKQQSANGSQVSVHSYITSRSSNVCNVTHYLFLPGDFYHSRCRKLPSSTWNPSGVKTTTTTRNRPSIISLPCTCSSFTALPPNPRQRVPNKQSFFS